jgi:hypothetical protein
MKNSQNDSTFVSQSNATSIEAREAEMIALAYDAAERRLREGTASAAEIVHFLKLGSTTGYYEKESLRADIELKRAKVEAIHQAETLDGLYREAIESMKRYTARSE